MNAKALCTAMRRVQVIYSRWAGLDVQKDGLVARVSCVSAPQPMKREKSYEYCKNLLADRKLLDMFGAFDEPVGSVTEIKQSAPDFWIRCCRRKVIAGQPAKTLPARQPLNS